MRAYFSLAWQGVALALGVAFLASRESVGAAPAAALGAAGALALAAHFARRRALEHRALRTALRKLLPRSPQGAAAQPLARDQNAARQDAPERDAAPQNEQQQSALEQNAAQPKRPERDHARPDVDAPARQQGAALSPAETPALPAALSREFSEVARLLRARERRAEASQQRLLAVLNSMGEGVLVLDEGGRTLLANRRLRQLFDVWGAVEGKSALELLRRADVDEALTRATNARAPMQCEVLLGGEPARVLDMQAVRFPAAGVAAGTVAVFHDVSELHRLERVRRDFVANVSHELRTPLTAIRGFTQTLLGGAVPPAQQREQLEIIQRHSERLGALIEDLLELSRIEAENRPLETQPIHLAALARSLLRDLRPRLEAGELTHELDIGDELRVRADRRALERVLLNLLDNALSYTRPGGALRISARARDARRVRLEVTDTGIGLGGADLARVFERFYRADAARGLSPGGSGLGLSIVKHLVQAMDGEVSAHHGPGGAGARFCVSLPAADAPAH